MAAALYNDGGMVTLTDCTVSGNSAVGNGGGLYTGNYGATTLTCCTVSGNSTLWQRRRRGQLLRHDHTG